MICKRCQMESEPDKTSPSVCAPCVRAERTRTLTFRQHNPNWMEIAKEASLELWERQPGETDHEYNVWLNYRDAYPGKKPTYRDVAESVGIPLSSVKQIGSRWDFTVRIQAWAKYVDEVIISQRREEVISMNKRHVAMAELANEKLLKAINAMDPSRMRPTEIAALLRLSTELERKARLDHVASVNLQEEDTNPELKQAPVKTDDMATIVGILGAAGLLGNNFGVRQTVTTEVVTKND